MIIFGLILLIETPSLGVFAYAADQGDISNNHKKCRENKLKTDQSSFPRGFIFGASTSAVQIEGAWNKGGKGENIWDRIIHTHPGYILDGTNADVSCNSYYLYKEDVKNVKEIGFDFYRFSISWARILPTGKGNINAEGLTYYNNLINSLLENQIQPMVTIYHWDLPQALEEKGGWLNSTITEYFENYARILFENFGDRVKFWITINEPINIAGGYGSFYEAPALDLHGTGGYEAGHNILLAHMKAYRVYENKFKKSQNGKISISLSSTHFFPFNNSEENVAASNRAMEFDLGWFAHPIYTEEGDYPKVMRELIDRNSKLEGRSSSRLPRFTEEQIELLKGSADFFALQHYTSRLVKKGEEGPDPSWLRDANILIDEDPSWPTSKIGWLKVVPEGIRASLQWVKEKYGNPKIIITENGYGDVENDTKDYDRISYLSKYLNQTLMAIHQDRCKVIGYFVWSIMDNFEWSFGYRARFGLYRINFNDQSKKRVPKLSALFMKNIIKQRQLH